MNDDFEDDDEFGPSEDPRNFEPSPSEQTQFKTGKPGGPGRPIGSRGKRKIVKQILLEKHEIREGGVVKRLTAFEIIAKVVRNHSLESDRALAALEDLVERCGPQSRAPRPILAIFPEELTSEMWEAKYGDPKSD